MLIPNPRIEALRTAFPELGDDMLTHLARNARDVHAAPGDRICEEGEPGDIFYVIMSGRVQASKFLELGIQRLLKEIHAGEFFGELALLEDAPRVASIYRVGDARLLAISKQDFQALLASSPATAVTIMRTIASRLRDADRRSIEELRRKNEDLARAYAELEDVTKRKSEFLTVVAHELRTPLTAIKGYAHLIRLGLIRGDDLQRTLSVIVNNTEAIVRLVNNILFLQELELIPPTFEPVDMVQLVNSAVDAVKARAMASGLTFKLELPPDLPKARGDLDGIAQAFAALIDNAIKFSPNGGEIELIGRANGNLLEIEIADPGVGIPAEHLYHIFDRYQHLDAVGEHLFGGIGLGLPIAKQVVEQHGGNISVVSRIGEGSTFTVRLPIYREGKPG